MYTKSFKAFTIVELMVVVVILGILSVIGFVSYSNYTLRARDTNRIGQMTKTVEAFQNYATRKKLPEPNNSINLVASGFSYAKQGKLGSTVIETMELDISLVDPKDKLPYTYLLANNRKHFQFLALMEQAQDQTALSMNQSFAGYEKRYPRPFGTELGILAQKDTNIPLEDLTITGGTLDITQVGSLQLTSYLTSNEYVQGTAADFDKLPALLEGRGKGWRVQNNNFICIDTNSDGRCGDILTAGSSSIYTLPSNLADIFLPSQPFDDYWTSNTCSSTGTVINVSPGVNQIPTTIPINTIYQLASGDYIQSSFIYLSNCSAIIAKTGANIYNSVSMGAFGSSIRFTGINGIIYGIKLDSINNGAGGTHAGTRYGFYIAGNNNTIFSSQAKNYTQNGIYAQGTFNIYLNDVTTSKNGQSGIDLGRYSYVNKCKSFSNTESGIQSLHTGSTINLCNVYNNGERGINTGINTPFLTMNNIMSYNNHNYSTNINDRGVINNSAIFKNKSTAIVSSANTIGERLLSNSILFKNLGYGISVDSLAQLTTLDIKIYGSNALFLPPTKGGLKYFGGLHKFENGSVYNSPLFFQGTGSIIGFSNGTLNNTGAYTSDYAIIPSTVGWNHVLAGDQIGLVFDGNETYTYGSLIPNQTRPLRYNQTTSQLEYYGVDGVDYDSTKKIGQW